MERSIALHDSYARQSDGKDEGILIERDEEEIEQSPEERILQDAVFPKHCPAVILNAGPEFPGVGSFQGKVRGETDAPERSKDCHDK